MLVLSRKPNEALVLTGKNLPEPIRVVVVSVTGSRVKLGIIAEPDVKVTRDELINQPVTQVVEVAVSELASDAAAGAVS